MTRKVIVITGASGGIGRTILPQLAQQGHQLVLAARHPEPLADLAAQIQAQIQASNPQAQTLHDQTPNGSCEILTVPTDVTAYDQVEALVEATLKRFGPIDVLINAAGLGILKPAPQITPADLDRLVDVNLKGSFYTSQLIGNVMREQKSGHILNFPGILGRHPMAMGAGYCASKFGVVGFTKCMADELKRFGVKFTLFYFGGIDSPFWDGVGMKVQRDKMLALTTVADAILFTLSVPANAIPSEVVLQPESHQFI